MQKIKYEEEIAKSFNRNKSRFGRERLLIFLKKNNNISINSRTLGKYIKNSTYIIQQSKQKETWNKEYKREISKHC